MTSGHSLVTLLFTLTLATACDESSFLPEAPARYGIEVSGETFVVEVTSAEQVAALEARFASGEEGVLSGELAPGDGGYNEPWSWHMVPSTVEAPDMSIEVCDGRPSGVEDDLDYWIEKVERFCPWGATVVERLD